MRRRGVGAVGCLAYLLVIAGVAYFGGAFVGSYLNYYRFKDAMKQEARFAPQRTDIAIQSRLHFFADSLGLPATASMVRVQRSRERVRISSSYVETVSVPVFGDRKVRFNPKVEASF